MRKANAVLASVELECYINFLNLVSCNRFFLCSMANNFGNDQYNYWNSGAPQQPQQQSQDFNFEIPDQFGGEL